MSSYYDGNTEREWPGSEDDECDRCHGPLINRIVSGTMIFCSQACSDNYEPPDPPGWEGGFADNH